MRSFRRPVPVHPWLECDACLTLVADRELPRYQYHPLGRRVPVLRDHSVGAKPEEYIGVRFCWIAVENRQTATRR
jgi:hypothetical protein